MKLDFEYGLGHNDRQNCRIIQMYLSLVKQ